MARRELTGAAIISGGASGLGAATAEAFIAEGVAVLLADGEVDRAVDAVRRYGEMGA